MLNMQITDTLCKTFPEHSQKVGTALTLWESSENVLQPLCVSQDIPPAMTMKWTIGYNVTNNLLLDIKVETSFQSTTAD